MFPSKPTLRRLMNWMVVLSVLTTVYVLSVGPAVLLENRTQVGGRFLEVVYAPLFWLAEKTPARDPLEAYLGYFQQINNDWDLPPLVIQSRPTEIDDVPNESIVAGKKVHFEACLNRDFMPVCPPSGQRMGAFFKVTTVDRSYFPAGVRAEKAWVIHKNQAWIPNFGKSATATKENDKMCLIVTACGGPRWEPGIRVDIVIQLRDAEENVYLLQIKNQEVIRTE